ncbi:hypothetical protein SBI_01371 [Streptomyces bingchenggensis BCW-1]|uniref:Uncharacterized protein n=1 Tax=Streptomyces bingchenggensis (strain BCW-1) TaxID=749414 RepID=D7CBZ7_STRBB|nr:hypothetical protein SBI_01371 [Streptomyces bingchenggensis BCW-1]
MRAGSVETPEFREKAIVVALVDAFVAVGARGTSSGGEQAVRHDAAILQTQRQLERHGGPHTVAEQRQRTIGPGFDNIDQEIGEFLHRFDTGFVTTVLTPGILHRENVDLR